MGRRAAGPRAFRAPGRAVRAPGRPRLPGRRPAVRGGAGGPVCPRRRFGEGPFHRLGLPVPGRPWRAGGGSAPADPDPSAPGTAEGGAAAGDGADALEPASASPAPAAAKRGWDVASDGSVRYYGDDGSLHTGWLVDDSYMDYGLQRYWFGVDGVMARSRLVDAADAGWWAYATARGYVVRGRYVDPSTGYVYLADNDGRLASPGWVVSDAYGQGLQRYWVDAGAHACVPGYSPDGWDHWTTSEGYVLRGAHREGDLVYLADNDGRLASPGWVVSDAYGQGLQRYWVDAGRHAAVVGYSHDGWDHWTTSEGYVARGAFRDGDDMLWADNDGRLMMSGWLVTSAYGQGLQRYWVEGGSVARSRLVDAADAGWWAYATARGYVVRGRYVDPSTGYVYLADNDGRLASPGWVVSDAYGQGLQRYWVDAGRHAAVVGYFQVGEKWYYGTSNGYVLRGKSRVGAGMLIADNDGLLIENYYGEGWVVTDQFDGEMQRYRIDYSCDGHLGAHLGLFSLGDKQYYGRYDYGYVVRNVVYTAPDGSKYYGDNDGVLGALPCLYSDMYSRAQGYSSSTSTLILVDTVGNRIAIYSGHQGAWSPLIEARCVSGAPATPTIKGSYSTTGFTRTSLDTDSRARWCTQISGGYFFHTILASESELGNNLSHGCIRLSVGNAQWIYNNVHKGTRVIIW